MKVAVAASGPNLDAQADPRFGRCQYFVLVDTETMETTALENTAALQGSGAGIAAVQLVANAGADAVIAGNLGPNAFQALAAGGIKAYAYAGGTVRQAVEALRAGTLPEISGANVPAHYGMGGGGAGSAGRGAGGMGGGLGMGMGRGMGMGGGRGVGGGMGMGRGMGMGGMSGPTPTPPGATPTGPPAGVEQLEAQAQALEAQLQDLRRQLEELRNRTEAGE